MLQVIGTAIALLLLSGGAVPLWAGVLLAAAGAYAVLLLERVGVRYLEGVFEFLIAGGWGWVGAGWVILGPGAAHRGGTVGGGRLAWRLSALTLSHALRSALNCCCARTPAYTPAAVMSVSMGFLFFSADIPYADVLRGEWRRGGAVDEAGMGAELSVLPTLGLRVAGWTPSLPADPCCCR